MICHPTDKLYLCQTCLSINHVFQQIILADQPRLSFFEQSGNSCLGVWQVLEDCTAKALSSKENLGHSMPYHLL